MDTQEALGKIIAAPITFHTVPVPPYVINYAKAGRGPVMVLLHGANISWAQWYSVIPALAKRFTVIAPDWPGAGYSSKRNTTTPDIDKDYVETLGRFLKKLHIKNARIIAHSISGAIAVKLAVRFPTLVHSLILMNAMGFTDYLPPKYRLLSIPGFPKFLTQVVMKPTRSNMEQFLQSVFYRPIALPKEFIDHFYSTIHRERLTHPIEFMHELIDGFRITPRLSVTGDLAQLKQRILVLHGMHDPLIPADTIEPILIRHRVPYVIIPEAGHVPSIENYDSFMKEIRTFFDFS